VPHFSWRPGIARPGWIVLAIWAGLVCAPPQLWASGAGPTQGWDALFLSSGTLPEGAARPPEEAQDLAGELPEELSSISVSWKTTSEDVLQLTSDYVEYDRKAGRILLKGKSFATLGEMKLWAEGMEVELASGKVYATGKVRFRRPNEDISGQTLNYNYKLREGVMTKAETWMGPNRYGAESMEITPFKLVGTHAYTTACNHTPPHYKVIAERATMIPGERLVLEHASLRAGKKRLLSFSRYKVNLGKGDGGSNFYLRPGYSSSRGFTLESGYDFYFSDSEFGRVLLNPTSRSGGSGGLAFRYGHGKDAGGDLRLFRSVTRLGLGGVNSSAFLNQTADAYNWNHRQKLSNRTNFSSNLAVTKADVGTLGVNEELNYSANLTHQIPHYNLGLSLARRVDLDKGKYTLDDTIPVLNQSPRFTFARDAPLELGGEFRLGFNGAYGIIEERLSGQTQTLRVAKSELNMNLTGPALKVGNRTNLAWNFEDRINRYSANPNRNFWSTTVNGTTILNDEFQLAYNYVLQRVNGSSPFASFDFLNPQQLATLFFRQRKGTRFNATWMQLTKDLDAGKYRAAATNLFWHSPQETRTPWAFGLNLGYRFTGAQDLGDLRLSSISTNTRFGRERWRHQLITNYDKVSHRLGSFSLGSDFKIDTKWRMQVAANYGRGGVLGKLERTRLALALTRDLHAWEARLRWDVEQKQAFLEFYLKHNPTKKFALRGDYQGGTGLDLRPQIGDKSRYPGPILEDLPRP
jgi:hypothetical protein